ncbi:MAG: gliding motility-associated C-terminal domain-containing protein [Bacteroidota bacterium]
MLVKRVLHILILCLWGNYLGAQQIGRKVISTAGSSIDLGTINVSYTIGEIVVSTQASESIVLTQGFQQPDIICNALETQISTQNTTQRCKDGFSQFITLDNTGENVIPGVNYTFVVTSLDQTIIQSFSTNLIDLNLLPANSYRIYGVMHESAYTPIPGEKIQESDPSACRRVSSNFISIVFSLPPQEATIALPSTDTTLCGNPQINIRAVEPLNGSGQWRGSTGIQFVDPFSPRTLLTNLQPGPNTISWEISTPGCPPLASAIDIFYEPPADPAEIETGDFQVCEPSGHSISARTPLGGLSGVWSSKVPGVTFGPNTETPQVTVGNLPSDTTVLYWTVGEAPCQTIDSLILVNNEVQTAPQISTPPDTGAVSIICTNQILLEGIAPQQGEIASWSILAGAGLEFDPSNEAATTTLRNIPVGEEIQLVYEIDKAGCNSSISDTLRLFNKGGVTAATILQSDTTLCAGSGWSLEALPASPNEVGFWSSDPPISFVPGEESPAIQIEMFPIGETQLTWTIQAEDCPDNFAQVRVNVPDPNTDLFGTDTLAICQEDPSYILEPSIENLGNVVEFIWSTGESTPSIELNPEIGRETTVELLVLNLSGCTFDDQITLRRDSLDVGIEGIPICIENGNSSPAQLVAKSFGTASNLSFSWSNGRRTDLIQVSEPGLYQVVATSEEGCQANAAFEVVETEFFPVASPGDTSIILGSSVNLLASGGDAYIWGPEEVLSCTLCPDPTTQPEENTTYSVQVSTFDGCVSSLEFNVEVVDPDAGCEALFIPNILTPGDNGHNDVWAIEGLRENAEVYIYDRWGGEIFSENPFDNNWDGSRIGGSGYVDAGSYLYVLMLENGQVCRGSITVIPD